jgi:glucosamine-6-phosphate deaminase
MRNLSKVAAGWWDYTTLDEELLNDAARLDARDLLALSRPGFTVTFYDTLESFYVAEALEYVRTWQSSSDAAPAGICGPIGPTEQLPLVARSAARQSLPSTSVPGGERGSFALHEPDSLPRPVLQSRS